MRPCVPLECFLKPEGNGLLLMPGEVITPELDPYLYASQLRNGLSDVARLVNPSEPASFVLGLLQRHIRQQLMTLVNSHDLGLDGRPVRLDGRISRYTLRLADMASLLKALREFGATTVAPLERALADLADEPGDPLVEAVATFVSAHYKHLRSVLNEVRPAVKTVSLQLPPRLDRVQYLREDSEYRGTVTNLQEWAERTVGWAFDHLSVFGSLVTQDYVKGSSDIDMFGIVRQTVLESPESIMKLRAQMRESWPYLYSIDPLQHHGTILFGETDMEYYSQSDLPFVLLKYAVTISGAADRYRIVHERDSAFQRRYDYHTIRQYFRRSACYGITPTAFHYKLFISTFLLFPAIALQIEGQFRYKKSTFTPFFQRLNADNSHTLSIAMTVWRECLFGNSISWKSDQTIVDFHRTVRDEAVSLDLLGVIGQDFAGKVMSVSEEFELTRTEPDPWRHRVIGNAGQSYAYYNYPQARSPLEYDAARHELVSLVRTQLEGVQLIEFGDVKSPGISDVDVIIAVDDAVGTLEPIGDFQKLLDSLSPSSRYILFHPPSIIVRNSDLRTIGELYPIFSMRKMLSPQSEQNDMETDADYLIVSLVELSCHYFWTWNRLSIVTRSIDVRLALLTLNGLKHSYHCLQLSRTRDSAWLLFENMIDSLRLRWFSMPVHEQEKQVHQLLTESLVFQGKIIDLLGERIDELVDMGDALPDNLPDGTVVATLYRNQYFITGWNCSNALRVGMLREATTPERAIILPGKIASLLAYYSQFDTPLGQFLRVNFSHRFAVQHIRVSPKVETRRVKMEKHLQWLGKLHMTWGQVPHWPLNPARPSSEVAGLNPERIISNLLDHGVEWFDIDQAFANIDHVISIRAAVEELYTREKFQAMIDLVETGDPVLDVDGKIQYFRSLAACRIGRPLGDCVKLMNRAIDLGSDPFWSFYQRACFKANDGNVDGAISDLASADNINPGNTIVNSLLQSLRHTQL